jgi:hypothetical protein
VVDGRGNVVGVVVMKLVGGGIEGIGLALPINYIYSPDLAYVAPPAPAAAASDAFATMLARAKEESTDMSGAATDERAEEGGLGGQPLLVSAHVDQYQRLVVKIVRAADAPPPFEEVAIKVWDGSDLFCTVKGDVSEWKKADLDRGPVLDPRARAFLRKLDPQGRYYVGESPLRWDLCDKTRIYGAEIELEGASPHSVRLRVN